MPTQTLMLPYDTISFPNMYAYAKGMDGTFSTFGWVPSSSGAELPMMNNTTNQGTATITNIAISSNVVTVTASHNFPVGQPVTLTGLTTATYLNGRTFLVASKSTNVSFTFSQEFSNNTLIAFTHGDVGSASDTGTCTSVTNWSTTLQKPDDGAGLGLYLRYRGPYVSSTPAFTTLQVSGNTTIITCPGHGLPIGGTSSPAVGQGFNITNNGGVFTNASFTFLNTNPTGTAGSVYAGWPILSVTATQIILNTSSSPRADVAASSTNVGGIGSPMYMTTNVSTGTSDVCSYEGDFYYTVNATSFNVPGTLITPGTDTTRLKRMWSTMWKSADALTSTAPIYVKLLWGVTTNAPLFQFWTGQAVDGSGNINMGNCWGSTTPSAPTISTTNVNLTGNTLWESNFSGSSGRFSMIMWRGYTFSATTAALILNIERSRDSNGNETDAYWTMQVCMGPSFQTQVSVFKIGTGSAGVLENAANAIKTIQCLNAQALNNNLPVLPTFPMVGYLGNPMINLLSGKAADLTEGAVINATMYGVSHPYLVSKSGSSTSGGPANFGNGTNNGVLLRWE